MEVSVKKSIFKEWWFYVAVIAFIIVIYLILPKGSSNGYSNMNEFAQCLSDKGAKMYGTTWCPHCNNQKEMFGSSFKNINFIDCDLNKEACLAALVGGYPTWNINGINYPGEQSLEVLSQVSGCELVRE